MIVIRQKEFARADYAGLTPENAAKLKEQRAKLARKLKDEKILNKFRLIDKWTANDDVRKLRLDNMNTNSAAKIRTEAKKAREALLESQQPKPSKFLDTNKLGKSASGQNPKAAKSGVLSFIKANPKTSAAIAGTTALIGSGVMAYNHYKNKDKE